MAHEEGIEPDRRGQGHRDEPEQRLKSEEFELRRYEARMGLLKVVYGTMIVGLAGVLIPAAIEGWGLVFQQLQYDAKLNFESQSRQQEFLTKHFNTAINESLDLRSRFAEYYAFTVDGYDPESGVEGRNTTPDATQGNWTRYYKALIERKEEIEKLILEKEEEVRLLMTKPVSEIQAGDEIKRGLLEVELAWLYDEIEYAVPGRDSKPRASVISSNDTQIILQMASYSPQYCDTAQEEIEKYGSEAFGRTPTLWLANGAKVVVVGLAADNLEQANQDLTTALKLSKQEKYKSESLDQARIRTNPEWVPLERCADLI
ncbi:hypothetical protein K1W69_24450 [Hoeflea sp. WL0058]|uniref:Uncharacterized protein n=1 Tax=Flavimaribacter sediminis TaxID=2865987 RepID=A0AAE2ZT43_9HYPH|nr:hypothetical protein [Flavimaribacter sediminis]MBW8640365.1 hypothetical protein [Flavimaribacter sediminis]